MQLTGNTIFITGGGTGIGRTLAEGFQRRGNTVIIGGRRADVLAEVVAANPGMHSLTIDVDDAGSIRRATEQLFREHPTVNVLVNNAGIFRLESITDLQAMLVDAEATLTTNLLAPIRLTNAFLAHFHARAQRHPEERHAVVNVTSGLAFVPLAAAATYCATKAALHSYSESLRVLLRGTSTSVVELSPPMVATEIHPGQSQHPDAMPVEAYAEATFRLIGATDADAVAVGEVVIDEVRFLRNSEAEGRYAQALALVNGFAAG